MRVSIADHEIDHITQVIEVNGEVDAYTAPWLKDRVDAAIESGKRHLIVDLSHGSFIDSTGLSVLVMGHRRLEDARGSFAHVCTDENMLEIFNLTSLDQVMPIHETRSKAAAALARGGDAASNGSSRL
jgi:anti-sigma B factor antagonist